MKKSFSLYSIVYLFLCLAAALTLTSCSSHNQPAETQRLTIWTVGSEGNKISLIAQDFERLNPDITLNIIKMDWEVARDRILTAISEGNTPDIAQVGTTWMAEFAKTGALAPLDDFVFLSKKISKSDFFDGPWQTNIIDNHLYGIPWYLETRFLFYRKDLLTQQGFLAPPRNWQELAQYSAKLTQDLNNDGKTDIYGLSLGYFDAKTIAPFVWQNDGSLFNANFSATTLSGEKEREALKFYINLFRNGYVLPRDQNPAQAFVQSKCAMTIEGPWYITILRKQLQDKDYLWGFTTLPQKKSATSFFGGSNFVIFNSCKNKQAAWRFLEFLSLPENQSFWFRAVSALPAVKAAWEPPIAFTDKKYIDIFKAQLHDAQTFPAIPQIEIITTVIEKHMLSAINSSEDIDTLIDQLCQEIDALLQH